MTVGVVQVHAERCKAFEHGPADAARGEHSDVHPFEVVRAGDRVRDVPSAIDDDLVLRDVVTHECEDLHDGVFGHTDRVRVGDLCDGDALFDGGLQVHVVRPDSCCDRELQILRGLEPFRREIRRPKRLRDDDIRVRQLAVENGVGAFFVAGDDYGVPFGFQPVLEPQATRDRAEEVAGSEVDRPGGGERLAVQIGRNVRKGVARVGGREPADRVRV